MKQTIPALKKRQKQVLATNAKVIDALREAIWALSGKEYDPKRYDSALRKCRVALGSHL